MDRREGWQNPGDSILLGDAQRILTGPQRTPPPSRNGAGMDSDDSFTTGPGRFHINGDYSFSRIIVGGWQFSSGHGALGQNPEAAAELFAQLLDRGFTTFDCADIYRGVEELIGGFLLAHRHSGHPAQIQVHTKFVPDLAVLPTIDKAYVVGIIDRSLSRLGVERLDLVQFHWWDFSVPGFVETAHWLKELQEVGKIRHLGVTNFDGDHLDEIVSSGISVVSNQVQYSALDRRPGKGLAQYCRDQGIVLLCYGALAGGFLTDQYGSVDERPEELANRSLTKYRLIIDELGGWGAYRSILDALKAVARRHRTATASIALKWVLDQPGVAATITGMDSVNQADQLLGISGLSLDEEDQSILGAALTRAVGPGGDVYELERDMAGPHGRIMRYNLNRDRG